MGKKDEDPKSTKLRASDKRKRVAQGATEVPLLASLLVACLEVVLEQ